MSKKKNRRKSVAEVDGPKQCRRLLCMECGKCNRESCSRYTGWRACCAGRKHPAKVKAEACGGWIIGSEAPDERPQSAFGHREGIL